jgi:hypothetical protein
VGRTDGRPDPGPGRILTGSGFHDHAVGRTASLGIQPLQHFGAELQYFDFGHPSTTYPFDHIDARATAVALFGVGYLPLPVSGLELYAKAGDGHLQVAPRADSPVPSIVPRL